MGALVSAVLAGLLLVAGLAMPAAASDQRGVAVDLGRIDVDEPLRPGQSYSLPELGVRNPGSVAGDYRMALAPVRGDRAPESSWVRFDTASFSLAAGAVRRVESTIVVPPDAPAGDYEALLSAQLVTDGGGARVGAAAAARLTFTITSGPSPATDPDVGALGGTGWLPVLVLALAVLLAVLIRKGSRYRIRFERRT